MRGIPRLNVVSRFVYGSSSITPDYVIKGGSTYKIFSDQIGSPRVVVDASTRRSKEGSRKGKGIFCFNGAASHRRGDPTVWRCSSRTLAPASMEPRLIDAEI